MRVGIAERFTCIVLKVIGLSVIKDGKRSES